MVWGRALRQVHRLLIALLCCAALAPAAPAWAHETDNYTMPPEREFADWGRLWTHVVYENLEAAVEHTNERIRRAELGDTPTADPEAMRRVETVQFAFRRTFPPTLTLIDEIDRLVATNMARRRYPGQLTYYEPFEFIYSHSSFPLDPRQIFKLWRAAHMQVAGVHLGSDKLGHFLTKGHIYYLMYRAKLHEGMDREEAISAAIEVGISEDLFFSEKRMLGYWSSGVFSNADLAADYLGLKFYINLTEPVSIGGETRPPMLALVDGYWRLADHVRRDTDFFTVFISDHLNEALNPNLMEPTMRLPVRRQVEKSCEPLLDRYSDRFGNRRSRQWFDDRMRELSTYFGAIYGHKQRYDDMVTIGDTCFPEHEFGDDGRSPLGRTRLHQAAADGDQNLVHELLAAGADVDARVQSTEDYSSEWGDRPLHYAAREAHADLVRLLLAYGAEVNAASDRGVTPLHRAAQVGGETVRILLDAGADVSAADEQGRTVLHWAATYPRFDVVAWLIQAGADVGARDHAQRTPLHYAAQWNQPVVIAMLLEAGAELESRAAYGVTPLWAASRLGRGRAVAALLEAGADPAAVDDTGRTPLHVAAAHTHSAIAEALLAAGAAVDARDVFNVTPLHEAAGDNNTYLIGVLIDAGADPHATDRFGRTPLHVAARANHRAALDTLVELGGDAKRPDWDGKTARELLDEAPPNLVDFFTRLGTLGAMN